MGLHECCCSGQIVITYYLTTVTLGGVGVGMGQNTEHDMKRDKVKLVWLYVWALLCGYFNVYTSVATERDFSGPEGKQLHFLGKYRVKRQYLHYSDGWQLAV